MLTKKRIIYFRAGHYHVSSSYSNLTSVSVMIRAPSLTAVAKKCTGSGRTMYKHSSLVIEAAYSRVHCAT